MLLTEVIKPLDSVVNVKTVLIDDKRDLKHWENSYGVLRGGTSALIIAENLYLGEFRL